MDTKKADADKRRGDQVDEGGDFAALALGRQRGKTQPLSQPQEGEGAPLSGQQIPRTRLSSAHVVQIG
jgi:hypothetical protein